MTTPITLEEARIELLRIADRMKCGCGNSGCLINNPPGMHTNGPCRCSPKEITARLFNLVLDIEAAGVTWIK